MILLNIESRYTSSFQLYLLSPTQKFTTQKYIPKGPDIDLVFNSFCILLVNKDEATKTNDDPNGTTVYYILKEIY